MENRRTLARSDPSFATAASTWCIHGAISPSSSLQIEARRRTEHSHVRENSPRSYHTSYHHITWSVRLNHITRKHTFTEEIAASINRRYAKSAALRLARTRSHTLRLPGAFRSAGTQAGRQAGKQAGRQAGWLASKQASRQAARP